MASDARVRGRQAIARAVGCSVRQTYRLETRPTDPLRLRCSEHDPVPWALRSRLVAFGQRLRQDPAAPRILGWPAIAALVGVSEDLVQRLERRERDPLPVHRTGGRVWAYEHGLLDWLDAQDRPHLPVVVRGGPTRREDVCPPASVGKAPARESASGDRARSGAGSRSAVKGAKVRPCQAV